MEESTNPSRAFISQGYFLIFVMQKFFRKEYFIFQNLRIMLIA